MAVAFDAVGTPASQVGVGTSPITWTHVCAATATELLVAVSVDSAADASLTVTATYNSVSMSSVLRWQSGGSGHNVGFLQVFRLQNPSSGSHTVSVAVGGTGSIDWLNGGSLSFTGSATIGTAAHNDSAGASVTSASVVTSTTSASNIVAAFLTDGSGGIAITAGSSQWIDTASSASNAAGYSAGATIAATGSNVTVSWTQTSDYFAAIGVEVQIPSALATLVDAPVPVNMPVIVTGRAGWRNAGHSR